MNMAAKEISKAEAAARLKCHPRTITRMVNDKELTGLTSGKVLVAEIEHIEKMGLTTESAEQRMVRQQNELISQQGKMMKEFFKEAAAPIKESNKANKKLIRQVMRENRKVNKQQLKTMGVLGEILLRTEERKTEESIREHRRQLMNKAFGEAMKWAPKIAAQVSKKGAIYDFIQNLKPEHRDGVWDLVNAFEHDGETEQAKRLTEFLTDLGLKKPSTETESADAESSSTSSEEKEPESAESKNGK